MHSASTLGERQQTEPLYRAHSHAWLRASGHDANEEHHRHAFASPGTVDNTTCDKHVSDSSRQKRGPKSRKMLTAVSDTLCAAAGSVQVYTTTDTVVACGLCKDSCERDGGYARDTR